MPKTLRLPGPAGVRFLPVREIRKIDTRGMCPDCGAAVPDGADACPECKAPMSSGRSASFEVAVSSEYEVTRQGWDGAWREVLDHSPGAIELDRFTSGSAPVLVDHAGDQVGVIESARIGDDKVLRAVVRFSRSARGQEIQQDVEDGIRSNISVGYIPKRAKLVETNKDLGDLWRMTLWNPLELSIVAVPADPTVGVGRSGTAGAEFLVEIEDGTTVTEVRNMKRVRNELGVVIEVADDDPRTSIDASPAVTATRGVSDSGGEEQFNRRASEIIDICEANGVGSKASDMIRRGLSVGDAALEIMKSRRSASGSPASPAAESLEDLGMARKDIRQYSYSRAIMGAAALGEGKKFAGIEAEVHQELERGMQGLERRGGVLVPMQKLSRTLDSKTGTKGAETVFEQAGELIELFRNRTAVIRLGARNLTGLTAPIAFPKQSGAATAFWVGENSGSNVTASDVAFALAQLTPRTLQATTAYARQLLVQASLDVENLVRDELALVHAIAIDFAAIHGLGSSGEPTGIYNALNVSSHGAGGAMAYANVLTMQGQVASKNADLGSLGWLMHPTVATNLKGKSRFTNTDTPVWEGTYDDGRVGGYKAIATNQVSNVMTGSARTGGSELGNIFGNFGDMIVGSWGALELVVDPYAQKKQGLIEVTSFQLADVLARHGESFSKSTGATG